MKYIKRFLFVFVLFVFNAISVNAGICDKENLDVYKKYYDNLDIKYEMDEDYGKGVYKINIDSLLEDTSVRNKDLNINEAYNSLNNGLIVLKNMDSGVIYLNFYYDRCDMLVTTRKVNIPIFNKYSLREECMGIEDLDVCMSDYEFPLNESTFLKKINDYNKTKDNEEEIKNNYVFFNKIFTFLSSYYLYIIGSIIIIVFIVTYFTIRKRRYTLE